MTTLEAVGSVVDIVTAMRSTDYRIVIGIAGSPGAGKSTLAAELTERLGADAALLPMDGFHLSQATLVERGSRDRMGAPDTFDLQALLSTLIAVRRGFGPTGGTVRAPGFDRDVEEPIPDAIEIPAAASCVVIEGNYLLLDSGGWERIAPLLDLRLFLELDRATRRDRLVARHVRFGKSEHDAVAWSLGPDETNATLIEPTAARADYRIALR